MEKILKKVDELAEVLEKAIEQENERADVNSKEAEANKGLRSELNKKAKDLKSREEAVKPIEDVAAYKVEASQLMNEAKKKLKGALMEQDLADKMKVDNRQEHAKQKAIIVRDNKKILDEKAGIDKGYKQLREAEKNSETKILKGIVNKAVK